MSIVLNDNFKDHVERKIKTSDPWYTLEHFKWANLSYIRNIYNARFGFIANTLLNGNKNTPLRLLDLGCGDGYWIKRIEELNINNLLLTGVDYNHLRIERAREILSERTRLIVDDAYQLNIDKQDIVLCMHVIEHVHNDVGFLQKISSIISKDGILLLGTPNEGNFLMQRRNRKHNIFECTDHVHFYVEELIKTRIRKSGFEILETYYDPFYCGNDNLFYHFLKSKIGLSILLKMSKIFPYLASGFIFKCKPL